MSHSIVRSNAMSHGHMARVGCNALAVNILRVQICVAEHNSMFQAHKLTQQTTWPAALTITDDQLQMQHNHLCASAAD